jgi:opacity protein-like surface antigen
MANLWYDYDLGNNFSAIFGGGLGAAHLNVEYNAALPTYFGSTAQYRVDDGGWGFAYQVGAGLGYDLGGGMMLSAQYRYFATSDIDVGRTDLSVTSHNFLVGLNIPLGGN